MKFTISAVLALAASATAMSLGGAKEQCTNGDLACCDSKETLSGDGILGNLLGKGALNGLLGNDDAACAKTSALDDLNVLCMTPIPTTYDCMILTNHSPNQGHQRGSLLQEHCCLLPLRLRQGKTFNLLSLARRPQY